MTRSLLAQLGTVCALSLILVVTGCSIRRVQYNEPISTNHVQFISPGQTTMLDIVSQLGAPDEMAEGESGAIALYNWSDTKSAAMDFGALLRIFTPWSPTMTLTRTGIEPEQFMVVYDPLWTVRGYGFSRWPKENSLVWFWPF